MPVPEHRAQSDPHCPSQQAIHPDAARQGEIDAVRKTGGIPHGLKFVAVNPECERTFDLLIFEETILLKRGVQRDPPNRADPQFHTRPRLNTALFPDHPHRGKCRTQQLQRVLPFVECEDSFYGRVDDNALRENWQIFCSRVA